MKGADVIVYFHLKTAIHKIKPVLFIYFGCAGSSLLCRLFSSCSEWRLLCSCHVGVSHYSGVSCCGACALGCVGFNSCGTLAQ